MDATTAQEKIQDPARLAVLHQLGLLDTPAEAAFDRLTKLASLITGSPISLVALIDADRSFFKSAFGLPEPIATEREAPLSHSLCQYVVADLSPLISEDTRLHPVLKDNGAVVDFDVLAYLGMPLRTSDGVDLGSFCVLDIETRQWTERDIEIMRELAMSVMTEIELRAQVTARKQAEEALIKKNNQYKRTYVFAEQTLSHMQETIGRGAASSEILVYLGEMQQNLENLNS